MSFFNQIFSWTIVSLCLLLFSKNELYCQNQEVTYSVENFFTNEGLPVIRFYDITQDQKGQIWVCTETGLYSFNGTEFVFKLDFGEINYYPNKIKFDNNQNIWLIKNKKYYSFFPEKKDLELKVFSPELTKLDLKHYIGNIANEINLINQNKEGVLYFYAAKTLYSFDQSLNKVPIEISTRATFYNDDKYFVLSDSTDVIIVDSKTNKLLQRIKNEKIYYVDRYEDNLILQFESGEFFSYESKKLVGLSEEYNHSPYFNKIIDKYGTIWGIANNWVEGFNLKTNTNENLDKNYFTPNSYLTSIYKDREENIWIGSNQGLYKFSSGGETQFDQSLHLGKSTRAILETKNNELFISTYNGDLIYNLESKQIKEISSSDTKISAVKEGAYYYTCSNIAIRKISVSDHQVLATKTIDLEKDNIYNPPVIASSSNGDLFIKQSHSIRSIDENLNLDIIYKDESCQFRNLQFIDDLFYLSTTAGLKVMNLSFEIVDEYLSDYIIQYVHKDKSQPNTLWVTTPSFLLKLNNKTRETKEYNTNSGFINSNFTSVQEDNQGNLWLPSFAGINKFNKTSEKNKVFIVGDGITNNEFNNYSSIRLSSGEYIFGGISGLTFVNPDFVEVKDITAPKIEISECIKINSTNQIDNTKEVSSNKKLNIEESDVLINMKFAHYSYKNLSSKLFRYRIINPSESDTIVPWVNLKSNELQLGKFPYGSYDLEFQAISRSGDRLSDINKIELEYVTPFMKTNLFKVFALLFLASFVYFIIHIRSQSLIQQKVELEKEVDIRTIQIQKQKEELEKINNTKDKLFSILAHDLKSPLITLKNISGKINYLIQKNQPDRILEIGKTIEDKVSNLSIFLDNILNWSLQQRGRISYNPIHLQLYELTQEILNIYEDHIEAKNLKVINKIPKRAQCFADKNSIHAVIRNLISNSIKYSPIGKEIILNFQTGKSFHIYSLQDSGKGIDQKIIDSLYNNEKIQSEKGTNGESGTGLGLLIVKELIELNKGHIKFLSNSNKGTKVEVHLPTEQRD